MKKVKKTGTLKSRKTSITKSKSVDVKSLTSDELFLYTLKEMGKPSLVRDMVATLKQSKQVSTTKRKLLAKLYASASHLNRDGIIKRTPVNGSMYAYRLSGWKKGKTKIAA